MRKDRSMARHGEEEDETCVGCSVQVGRMQVGESSCGKGQLCMRREKQVGMKVGKKRGRKPVHGRG